MTLVLPSPGPRHDPLDDGASPSGTLRRDGRLRRDDPQDEGQDLLRVAKAVAESRRDAASEPVRVGAAVRGAMNPALLGAMVFAVPFAGLLALRRRSRLALWSLVWMGANYLPFIPLVLFGQRVTYIYYFLPVVPALAAAIALLLLRAGLPRIVLWAFVAAYAWAYAAYLPFREIP